jgi:hypothetical protein
MFKFVQHAVSDEALAATRAAADEDEDVEAEGSEHDSEHSSLEDWGEANGDGANEDGCGRYP